MLLTLPLLATCLRLCSTELITKFLNDLHRPLPHTSDGLCSSHCPLNTLLQVNSVEREHFYRPFHGSEAEGAFKKYSHFLPRTEDALKARPLLQ